MASNPAQPLPAPLGRMRDHVERQREQALARARRRLARGEDPLAVLETLGIALTNKLLHAPLQGLKQTPAACEGLAASLWVAPATSARR